MKYRVIFVSIVAFLFVLGLFLAPKQTMTELIKLVNPINWLYYMGVLALGCLALFILYHQPYVPLKEVVDPLAKPTMKWVKKAKEGIDMRLPKPKEPSMRDRVVERLKGLPEQTMDLARAGGYKVFDKMLDLVINPVTILAVVLACYLGWKGRL